VYQVRWKDPWSQNFNILALKGEALGVTQNLSDNGGQLMDLYIMDKSGYINICALSNYCIH
jgi:glutamine amidotransferase-like uncharacterized protein